MTGKDFKEWMKRNGLRVSDIASKTGLDPNTIYAYRRDQNVHRTTRDILNRFVTEFSKQRSVHKNNPAPSKAVAG